MKRPYWIILAGLLMGQMLLAQSAQPSLAELARQNKSDRKTVKTFTDEDVRTTASVADSAPGPRNGGANQTSDSQPSKGQATDDGSAKSAATAGPSAKAAELKKQLESYQEQRDTWSKSAKRYESLLEGETNDFRREALNNAMENDKKNVALFQSKIDQAQTELANAQKAAAAAAAASSSSPAPAGGSSSPLK